jgi:hypothetical protein
VTVRHDRAQALQVYTLWGSRRRVSGRLFHQGARAWVNVLLTRRGRCSMRATALTPLKPRIGHGFKTLLSHYLLPLHSHLTPGALPHPQRHHFLRLQPT